MNKHILFLFACILLPSLLNATVPATMNYQGRILQNGLSFEGRGLFVFAIYQGGNLIWTNKYAPDASQKIPDPLNNPSSANFGDAMELEVRGGIFSVRLGTGSLNNRPLESALFFESVVARQNLRMEVWFSPELNKSFTKLSPDIQFATVPFAQVAKEALTVSETGGMVPVGTFVPFTGAVVPEGWVLCDGATYSWQNPKYARLAASIGTAFNTGNEPAGHFRVPDMRGRTAIGSGKGDTWSGAGGSTSWALGMKFGSEKHILTEAEMPSHNHGVTDPGHSHGVTDPGHTHEYIDLFQQDVTSDNTTGRTVGHVNEHTQSRRTELAYTGIGLVQAATGISIQSRGSNQPHNIMQPILVFNYIIKL